MAFTTATALVGVVLLLGKPPVSPKSPAGPHIMPGTPLAQLLRQAEAQVEKNPKEALDLALRAQKLAQKLHDEQHEAEATYLVADAARARGEYSTALEGFSRAQNMFTKLAQPFEVARCSRRLGDLYYYLTDYDKAMVHYLRAQALFLRLARDVGSEKAALHLAHIQAAMGNILRAVGNLSEAAEAYREAQLAYEKLGYSLGAAGASYNLGLLAQDRGQLDEALALYQKTERAAAEIGDAYLLSLARSSAGTVYLKKGDLQRATLLVKQALEVCQTMERARGTADNLRKLGEIALASGDPERALAYGADALGRARELGERDAEAEALELSSGALERLGRCSEALQAFREATALQLELRNAEAVARVNKLRLAYELMEKQQRLALLEASGKAERLVRWALLAGLLACLLLLGALAGRYHDRLRVERVIAQKNAELEAAYARVAELSRTDELTSLPNRRATLDFLVAEENRARQGSYTFSVVLCDLDDLKAWNDTFGHECGDAVLQEFAHTLVQNLRASDFVGRWGGDEFLIVLPATDQQGALLLAEKLRQAIAEEPLAWEGHLIHLRATFGVHQWAGENVRATIFGADEALYRGKREGKDQVRW